MNCEDLLKALNEYVDGEIDPSICEQFQEHLAECDPCQVVVDNIRHTIVLYRNGQPHEMPAEFTRAMNDLLRRRWKEKFSPPHPMPPDA
jgi:anti-sigma factor RsiW